MDTENALEFLSRHQPMPDDKDLSSTVIKKYDEVRKHFLKNKDKRCIKLLLNSFGYINGFGVYQLIEDVITQFSEEEVINILSDALSSDFYSVRYWNVQIAGNFPSVELLTDLEKILCEKDFDIKYLTLSTLAVFNFLETKNVINRFIERESDIELLQYAKEILLDLE